MRMLLISGNGSESHRADERAAAPLVARVLVFHETVVRAKQRARRVGDGREFLSMKGEEFFVVAGTGISSRAGCMEGNVFILLSLEERQTRRSVCVYLCVRTFTFVRPSREIHANRRRHSAQRRDLFKSRRARTGWEKGRRAPAIVGKSRLRRTLRRVLWALADSPQPPRLPWLIHTRYSPCFPKSWQRMGPIAHHGCVCAVVCVCVCVRLCVVVCASVCVVACGSVCVRLQERVVVCACDSASVCVCDSACKCVCVRERVPNCVSECVRLCFVVCGSVCCIVCSCAGVETEKRKSSIPLLL